MNEQDPVLRWLWPILASLAGAITALSFRPFQTLSRSEIFMALFVGASFAFFVAPLIFSDSSASNVRWSGAVYYLMATGSNTLIPFAIKKIKSMFGASGGDTP